jgi:hypothetical protein
MGACSTKVLALRELDPTELTMILEALEKQDFSTALSSVARLWLSYDSYTQESKRDLDNVVTKLNENFSQR